MIVDRGRPVSDLDVNANNRWAAPRTGGSGHRRTDRDGRVARAVSDWMVQQRNLAPATVLRYENTVRRFLRQQAFTGAVFEPAALTGADVNSFLLRECARVSTGSAKGRVAELRSILRFLYLQAITALRLDAAVPPVGGWRLSGLPKVLTGTDVESLLASCDRGTEVGIRDFASSPLSRGWVCARSRSPACSWATSTGGPGNCWYGAKHAARTACRCPPRWARPWSLTWHTGDAPVARRKVGGSVTVRAAGC